MEFGRLIAAMVTPFDANNRIDWGLTEKLIHHLIEEQDNDGLVICGTTGESPTVTEEEKLQLFSFAVKVAGGRCKIIAGTGDNETAYTVEMTKKAEATGVDGVLLVAPYYNRPSQEGLYRHFKAAAEATSLPAIIYNVPTRTSVMIEPETTIRLATDVPNVIATKEAISDMDSISKVIGQTNSDFIVYSGDDSYTLPMMSIGAYGIISVASQIVGRQMKAMIEAFRAGDHAEAARLHLLLHPIFKGLTPNPTMVKAALNLRGIPVGGLRLPLVEADADQLRNLSELLEIIQ